MDGVWCFCGGVLLGSACTALGYWVAFNRFTKELHRQYGETGCPLSGYDVRMTGPFVEPRRAKLPD